MSRTFDRLLRFAPLAPLRMLAPGRVVTFFYHLASSVPRAHAEHCFPYKSPEQFERDLVFLKQHFHVASYDELVWHQCRGKRLPPRTAVITVDDGFVECFTTIRGLLLRHDLPCTFFVCESLIDNATLMFRNKISLCLEKLDGLEADEVPTLLDRATRCLGRSFVDLGALRAFVDGLTYPELPSVDAACELLGVDVAAYLRDVRPYLSSEQLLQLHREGFTIGGHSLNHPELWLLPWADAEREIVGSCEAVRERTGQRAVPFAFPFNGARLERDRLAELRRRHDFLGLFFDTNNLRVERDFLVNRVSCDENDGAEDSRSNVPAILRSAYALEPLRRVKRLLQQLPN